MKKIFIFLVILSSFGLFAQNEVAQKIYERLAQNTDFKTYSVLAVNENPSNNISSRVITDATYAKIKSQSIAEILSTKPENIEIGIPYQGNIITLQLYRVNLFAEDFHVDSDKSKSISYQKGVYYRGIVKGDRNSIASFNFFDNELNGVISNHHFNNLNVGKLDRKDNVADYIVYSDSNLNMPNLVECHTKDVVNQEINNTNNTGKASEKCVTMYFEIDNDLFVQNGSDIAKTTNWITAVFNNVQTIFANDGISIAIKSLYIWTEKDPYTGEDSVDYLYQFGALRPIFDGDVGQLIGIDPGSLGGVAYKVNGLCSSQNYSYADVNFSYSDLPIFSWTVSVISHEFGHLLGSEHTHACVWNGNNTAIDNCGPVYSSSVTEGANCITVPPTIPTEEEKGTIMSYCHLNSKVGISLVNGFGPQPAAAIRATINNQSCLSADCVNTCINTVFNIKATEITNTSAKIIWEDNFSDSKWQISVTPFAANKNWIAVTTNSYSIESLQPNTFYSISIRPNCDFGLTAPKVESLFVTNANYCNGIVITDSGGTNKNYSNSENYIRTIIPNVSGSKIKLTFTSFNLEKDYDYLYVYDGNSTNANDLSNGGFTGTTITETFTSTAADGSLTLEFFSDGYTVSSGYVANVSCESNLGSNKFTPNIDFTYYPNPSSGIVTIISKTQIDEVLVYNIEGRLLYKNKINGLDTKVDMTLFSKGSYFFKLKFNEKEVNFKILKM